MEVSIPQFRREIFDLMDQAISGVEIWIIHKGRRFQIAPENPPGSRLSRITPLEVINPKSSERDVSRLHDEIARAWHDDWSAL